MSPTLSPASETGSMVSVSSTFGPNISISNAYERSTGYPLGEGMYKWEYLVEVFKDTTVEIMEPDYDKAYSWNLGTADNSFYQEGTSINVKFDTTGWHDLILQSEGETCTYHIMAKYVRREIRVLNTTDRESFFNALSVVYSVGQTEGEMAYGKKYRSIERLVSEHLLGAADKMCDHWHDDAGIMTHHVAFTLELEQGLQAIDETVTIPYWDYTQEAYYLEDWVNSEIFQPDWFGEASPLNSEHIITEGRWSYLSVGAQADPTGVRNPYGLLRSPWNTNPVAYVLRHRYVYNEKDGGWTLPGCPDFATAWSYTSLNHYFDELNGQLHGPVHIMLGGQWFTDDSFNMSYTSGGDFLLASKYLWRQGYVRCPELCTGDTPIHKCVCSCPSDVTSQFKTSREFLVASGLFNISMSFFSDWTRFKEDFNCVHEAQCYDAVVDTLCHVGHAGEMFTSAAPYDPVFWPIHGLADRYLQLKRIQRHENLTAFDLTWDYYHDGLSPSDTHHVCDWSAVGTTMKLPNCYPADCEGHRRDDLLPMGNFLDQGETYTNWEFFKFSSPLSDNYPYVYDTFTNWPACTDQGMEFWDLNSYTDEGSMMQPDSMQPDSLVTPPDTPHGFSSGMRR